MQAYNNLEILPIDILAQIFTSLTPYQLLMVALTSKGLAKIIFQEENNRILENKFSLDYPTEADEIKKKSVSNKSINWLLEYKIKITKSSKLFLRAKQLIDKKAWDKLNELEIEYKALLNDDLFLLLITAKNPILIDKIKKLIWNFYTENGVLKVNRVDESNRNFLHWQACFDEPIDPSNVLTIEKIVALGIDVNVKSKNDFTPLHFAAQYGAIKSVNTLLNLKGIEIDLEAKAETKRKDGGTPCKLAIEGGHKAIVDLLLEKKTKLQLTNASLAHYAAKNGNIEIMETVLAAGIQLDVKDNSNRNLLSYAIVYNQNTMVEFLLGRGLPIQEQDIYTICKAKKGNLGPMVSLLLARLTAAKHADIQKIKNEGLWFAAFSESLEIMEILLKEGAESNKSNVALNMCISEGKYNSAKFLIEKGADFLIEVGPKKSAISIAIQRNLPWLVDLMLDQELPNPKPDNKRKISQVEKNTLLISALNLPTNNVLKILLTHFKPDDELKAILLYKAIGASKENEMTHALLEYGAKPDFAISKEVFEGFGIAESTKSPFEAVIVKSANIVKLFLLHDKTLANSVLSDGRTALMHTLLYSKIDVAQKLIAAGADLNVTFNGKTLEEMSPPAVLREINFTLLRRINAYLEKCELANKSCYANHSAILFNRSNKSDATIEDQVLQIKLMLCGVKITVEKSFIANLTSELAEIYQEYLALTNKVEISAVKFTSMP